MPAVFPLRCGAGSNSEKCLSRHGIIRTLKQLIRLHSNNATDLRHLTSHSTPCSPSPVGSLGDEVLIVCDHLQVMLQWCTLKESKMIFSQLSKCYKQRFYAVMVGWAVTGQLTVTPTRGLDKSRMSPVVVIVLSRWWCGHKTRHSVIFKCFIIKCNWIVMLSHLLMFFACVLKHILC